jgi:hypothetical protein
MRIRAACHVHSDWSYDGKLPLSEIAAAFSRRGYRVVMLTEHDQGFDESRRQAHREACRQASTGKILLVPGIEYGDVSNTLHFLVWDNVPFIGTGLAAHEILTAAQNSGGVVVFAHPSRREAWKLFDPDWKDKVSGIELWNRKTDGWAPSRDARSLLQLTQAVPFVGMDFHQRNQFFPLTTVLEVEPPVTEVSVLESLRRHRCSSEAFGFPINGFASGLGSRMFRLAELFRRRAAPLYHRLSGS